MPWDLDQMYVPARDDTGEIRAHRCLDHPEINNKRLRDTSTIVPLFSSEISFRMPFYIRKLEPLRGPSGLPLVFQVDSVAWGDEPRRSDENTTRFA